MDDNPSEQGTGDGSLSQLEALLEQEEVSLDRLESLITDERSLLFGPDPRDLLDKIEEIEEGLSRIWQLDAARKRLADVLETGSCAGTDGGGAVGGALPSVLPRLLAFRHRILGVIARIGGLNEANSQLISGLARVGNTRLVWSSQTFGASPTDAAATSNRTAVERRGARLEVQA